MMMACIHTSTSILHRTRRSYASAALSSIPDIAFSAINHLTLVRGKSIQEEEEIVGIRVVKRAVKKRNHENRTMQIRTRRKDKTLRLRSDGIEF